MSRQIVTSCALSLALAALLAGAPCFAANTANGADVPAKAGSASAQQGQPGPGTAAAAEEPATDANATASDEADQPRSKWHRRASIKIDDFDSFKQAMDVAPWIVGVVFLVLGSIFLTPIILLVGIIWYKLRKTRLQNDAVLKLAERGVVPTAQAVDAVMAGTPPAEAAPALASATALPQAVATRRRAVWSDLRKGVLLAAVGLALVLYSIIAEGDANWLGLVLLFVGAGYVALWRLEDRHLERRVAGDSAGNDNG